MADGDSKSRRWIRSHLGPRVSIDARGRVSPHDGLAKQRSAAMTRDEARGWFVQVLMEKVRDDPYPSATQLALIEESIPRELVSDYLQVLIDKVGQDTVPSI